MKIHLVKYDKSWKDSFETIKSELLENIRFTFPEIEHIGSTSIEGLSAKPIIDVLVGLNEESLLNETIKPLIKVAYQYYEVFNTQMPYRRFFTKHKEEIHKFG